MKRVLVIIVASAVAVAAAAPAAAETPRAGCAEANGPVNLARHAIGPLAAIGGVAYWADPAALETQHVGGQYSMKAPPTVRRGRTVTIAIARQDRAIADIAAGGKRGDAIRFTACRHRKWSGWAGGFWLKRPACLHLTARERGKRRVYRTVISFGMGDSCG
jgi:hypothetical protein